MIDLHSSYWARSNHALCILCVLFVAPLSCFQPSSPQRLRLGSLQLMMTANTTQPHESSSSITSPNEKTRIDWIVRPATASDEQAVRELLEASYETAFLDDYDPEKLDAVMPLIVTPSKELLTCGTWYVVEHPANISMLVGCGGWTESDSFEFEDGEKNVNGPILRHFATHPSCSRMGVGTAIWNQTQQDLLARFDDILPALGVYSSLTARSFYESLGFQVVGTCHPFQQSDNCEFPCWIMRREAATLGN